MTSMNKIQFGKYFTGVFLSLVLLCSIFSAGCNGTKSNTKQPIKIGAVLPLTGDSSAWGDQGKKGIESAVREINETGGIDGQPIEVVYEDSQANPRLAVSAISKLISVDKVPAVVGDIVSATTLTMAPVAEENKAVLIAPSASAPAITDAGQFIYRVWPSDLLEGSELAKWSANKGYKKVSIVYISTDYGLGLSKVFQQTFESLGGAILSSQGYPQEETNFKPYLTRVKSENPDAVYLISYYKDAALALKQAKEIGLGVQFLGATAVESPELVKLAGTSAEGLIYPTIVDFDPANPNDSQRIFIENFRKAYNVDPDWAGSHAHDALIVIAEAMRAGARTGDEIRQAIDKRREFSGVTGRIIFNDKGDVIDKPVAIKTVRNGKFEPYK